MEPKATSPNASLIRDADLRKKLEHHRGRNILPKLLELEIQLLAEEQVKRDTEKAARAVEVAAMPRAKRSRVVAADTLIGELPEHADLRYMHSIFAICGLPYTQPEEKYRYSFSRDIGGGMGLSVVSLPYRVDGKEYRHAVPYGPKARLILMHLCSEALRQNSPTIELAETFTAFVRELGFDDSGGPRGALTAFRDQLLSLAHCAMTITTSDPSGRTKGKNFTPIQEFDLWFEKDARQQTLWPSTLTFSPEMFKSLKRHAVPVNSRVLKPFHGSARRLDLIFWAGWRLYHIDKPLHISWEAAASQFGQNFKQIRDFRLNLKKDIEAIKEVLPKLPLSFSDTGLVLKPADPEVMHLPAPRRIAKKSSLNKG